MTGIDYSTSAIGELQGANQFIAPGPTGSAAADTTALKALIAQAITTGGIIQLHAGTYKINETLDFSAIKGTNRALRFLGVGTGNIFGATGYAGTTSILNESGSSAITAYGTLASGVSNPIVSLDLGGFIIKNTSNIGASTYTIDLDYLTQFGLLDEIYLYGEEHTGNGFRLLNTTNGGTVEKQIISRAFTSGVGHNHATEVTSHVDTANNSGNSIHLAMHAVNCLTGVEIGGTNLFNSVSQISTKCVNSEDITGSVGIKLNSQSMQGTLISPHVERYSTGIYLNGTRGVTIVSPITTYPTGVPWLTTGSIESGQATLTVADGSFWANGDNIRVEGAGAAGAELETTVSSGGRTTTLTLAATAGTTVSNKKVTGTSAGVRYFNGPKNCTVLNHRATQHHYGARVETGSGNEHQAYNVSVLTALFSGEQEKRNVTVTLNEKGRTGNFPLARRLAARNKGLAIITETFDKAYCSASTALATETALGHAVGLCAGEVVTGIAVELTNSPTNQTLTKVGITKSNGEVVAKSASQHAGWVAAAHKDVNFESAYEVLEDDLYFLCVLTVGAATFPTLLRSNASIEAAIHNATNSGKSLTVASTGHADLTGTFTWGTSSTGCIWMAAY